MKKKKKQNTFQKIIKNKYTYLAGVLLLLVLSYLTVMNRINIEKYFRDILFYPSKNIVSSEFLDSLNNELEEENKELKSLLNISNSLSDYDIIYAVVIERNNSYWTDSLTINKGENDNILKGDIVVDGSGMVGVLDRVNKNNSTVRLITSSSKYNSTSVRIKGEEEINKILKVSSNKLVIEGINKNSKVKVGDKVVTTGLSNSFPSGIEIGVIASLEDDFYNVSKTATVDLSSDIENVRFVAILKRKL